jgi:hypothetical protein
VYHEAGGWSGSYSTKQTEVKRDREKAQCLLASTTVFLVLALIVYAALINPQFWRMGSALYGTQSDNFATVWYLWALARGAGEGGTTQLVSFPFGKSPKATPLDFLTTLPATWLTYVTNAVFAFNFLLFLGYILSGLSIYALVYLLTKRAVPSITCGLGYMMLPYHLAMSQYHFTLARVEVFPIFLLSLAWFLKRPHWYNVGWMLLAQFVSFAVDAHYGLFNFVVLVVFLSVYLFFQGERGWGRPTLKRAGGVLLVTVLAVLTGLPRFVAISQGRAEFTLGKPFEQLYAYSARGWEYFVPSVQHPIFGALTSGFVMPRIQESYWHEHTLYLGWTMLVMAGLGLWRLWHSRAPECRFLGVLLPLLALVGFLSSLAPTVKVLGLQIPMPASLLHWVFPMFRVYTRFGIVVATAVVALAGFGIAWLLDRVLAKRTVGVLIGALMLFEFINVPPVRYVDLSEPPAVYQWLAQEEGVRAIAEYPLGFPPVKEGEHLNLWDVYEYMLWQRVHGKPLFNGEPEKLLDLAIKSQLSDLSDPNTAARLGWLGISHVIVHREKMDQGVLQRLARNQNMDIVYSDQQAQAVVFRIVGDTVRLMPSDFRYPSGVAVQSLVKSTGDEEHVIMSAESFSAEMEEKEQLLVYGPYIALPGGQYRVQFLLAIQEKHVNPLRLVVMDDNGRTVLAQKDVLLSKPMSSQELSLVFYTEGTFNLEFRIYGCGVIRGLVFEGVRLEKAGDHLDQSQDL